jgi:hypothetical protein
MGCFSRASRAPDEDAEPHFYRELAACYRKAEEHRAVWRYAAALRYTNGHKAECGETAFEVMRKAAELGHADAQYQVGSAYQTGSGVLVDKMAAVVWWLKAAEQGHKDAQWLKAAEQGHADAQCSMASSYITSTSLKPVDSEAAVIWLRKAADQGHEDAQYRMGYACYNGHGVPLDRALAFVWWRKAAAQGNEHAKYCIRVIK